MAARSANPATARLIKAPFKLGGWTANWHSRNWLSAGCHGARKTGHSGAHWVS